MAESKNGLHKEEILKFPAIDLFSIALDVEEYPKFLPWCKDVVIVNKGENCMDVELVAGFMSIEGKYTSHVRYSAPTDKDKGWIRAESSDGVFRSLYSEWSFVPIGERETQVGFVVDFSFRSGFLQLAFEMASYMVQTHITNAFRSRVYSLLK